MKCKTPGCSKDAVGDASYCSDHKCNMDGCVEAGIPGLMSCLRHAAFECAKSGCGSVALPGSNYCEEHRPRRTPVLRGAKKKATKKKIARKWR